MAKSYWTVLNRDIAFKFYCDNQSAALLQRTRRFLSSTYRPGYASLKNFCARFTSLHLACLATNLNAISRLNVFMLLAFLLGNFANAKNLDFYRSYAHSQGKDPKKLIKLQSEQASLDRAQALRKLLGTDHLVLQNLNLKGPSLPHRRQSSLFFKTVFSDVAQRLYELDHTEKPPLFDPSDFQHEIAAKIWNRKLKACAHTIQANISSQSNKSSYAQATEMFWGEVGTEEKRKISLKDLIDPKRIDAIKVALSQYIPVTIKNNLGEISGIEVLDGVVSKIIFLKPNALPIEMSFGMLVSVRTKQDRYFLESIACFRDYLEREIGKKDKAEISLGVLQESLKILKEKQTKAQYANRILSKLSKQEQHFLIDLFLQLRKSDVPLPQEMRISKEGHESIKAQFDPVTAKIIEIDFLYYRALNEDLTKLEEFLLAEAEAKTETRKLIQEINTRGKL